MKRVLTNFTSLSDGNLESKTHSIINAMTANAHFPTPVPALSVVETASDNFSSALVKALTGTRADVADKNAKRETLLAVLRQLCSYVNLTANGNATMLLTSGFDVSKDPQPSVLTKPEIVRLENGVASGTLQLSVKAVKGAYSYLHEYTTDATMAPNSWVSSSSTSAKTLLTNLQPGTVYYCRVAAVGTNNQLLYSDAASRMVI